MIAASIIAILSLLAAATAADLNQEGNTVLQEMNKLRAQHQLPPLCLSPKLTQSALTQSLYQSQVSQMTHDNPLSIAARMLAAGFALSDGRAGENVGKEEAVVDGLNMFRSWQNSPAHYENIMNPKYNFVGVSVAPGKDEANKVWYWTVHFAQGAASEVCQDPSINQHVTDQMGTSATVVTPSSQIVSDLNQIIQNLLSADQHQATPTDSSNFIATQPLPPQPSIIILTQRAAEFTPPTMTITSYLTISMVSTVLVPTTIVNVVTTTVPVTVNGGVHPQRLLTCPPCNCTFSDLDLRPWMLRPRCRQHHPSTTTNTTTSSSISSSTSESTWLATVSETPVVPQPTTVLVLSNTSTQYTTTITPNLQPLTIPTPSQPQPPQTSTTTTPPYSTSTVYQCPTTPSPTKQ
jgi:hypothetical protein